MGGEPLCRGRGQPVLSRLPPDIRVPNLGLRHAVGVMQAGPTIDGSQAGKMRSQQRPLP